MTQRNENNVIMTAQATLGGTNYIIRVWQTEHGGFSPEAFALSDERRIYIGGEDDADAETPEAAIEQGRRLLAAQYEAGNLDAYCETPDEALGLEDALAVSDYRGARAEGADDYIYHVSEEQDEETGQRYYLLQITHGAMPPHYSERFDSISEMKQMRPLSEYPQLEWTAAGDAEV